MSNYKELVVWQKAILLVTDIYKLTKIFPKEELYGLASQMQRAVVSIPSNIRPKFKQRILSIFAYSKRLLSRIRNPDYYFRKIGIHQQRPNHTYFK